MFLPVISPLAPVNKFYFAPAYVTALQDCGGAYLLATDCHAKLWRAKIGTTATTAKTVYCAVAVL